MIRSFRDRDTERVFRRLPARRFAAELQRAAYRKLLVLDANSQWRICFRWEGDAHDVEITDYH